MARGVLVVIAALLVAVQVVRSAAVAALAGRLPNRAAQIWPGHPDSELALAMMEIGRAGHDRKPVAPSVFALVSDAARKAQLSPEPFLVRGVQAQTAGDEHASVQAFLAAEQRDPRSLPAHYFLADHYFRSGDSSRGLREVAVLSRLTPAGVDTLAPYLAAYAQDPRTWPQLREIFVINRELASVSLAALAADPANSKTVLALADKENLDPKAAWVPKLIGSLIDAGRYGAARDVWTKVSRSPQNQALIHDAGFVDAASPPPFNWELMSSAVGLAKRAPGGRLHVTFYGQQDGLLTRQLLMLAPGSYRLTMAVAGGGEQRRALTWSLRCDRTQTPFSGISLDLVASRPWLFTVPATCPAQWIELSGISGDQSQQAAFIISALKLDAEQPHD